MSEQAEQTSGVSGAPDSGSSDSAVADPTPVSAQAPSLVPDQNAAAEAPKVDAATVEVAKVEVAKVEAPKVETPNVDAFKATAEPDAARPPGKLLIVSSADHRWDRPGSGTDTQSEPGKDGKRRLAAAAVVALAALAGALGGAMATVGLQHFAGHAVVLSANPDAAKPDAAKPDLEASIARIDSDVVALKASVERTSKMGMSQFNKTSDRLDKLEKAQAEPAAKLAKLSEAVEKLRTSPPAAPAAAAASQAARDVTGSVTPPATSPAAAAAAAPKAEVGRLPIVDSWILRDVSRGGAWIESRRGIYEVYAGDTVPGLGHIDAVRRQDGRWVVVTSRGLIVAR